MHVAHNIAPCSLRASNRNTKLSYKLSPNMWQIIVTSPGLMTSEAEKCEYRIALGLQNPIAHSKDLTSNVAKTCLPQYEVTTLCFRRFRIL